MGTQICTCRKKAHSAFAPDHRAFPDRSIHDSVLDFTPGYTKENETVAVQQSLQYNWCE